MIVDLSAFTPLVGCYYLCDGQMSGKYFIDNVVELRENFINFTTSSNIQVETNSTVLWKRPKDICADAKLFSKDTVSEPVQGCLGNCWLVCACYILRRNTSLLKRIFGNYADFNCQSYEGKWNIRLFDVSHNKWVLVTIDDLLPTVNNALIFGCCSAKDEFWFPLLEKACAKFFGSYSALNSGQLSESFMLVTSGYCWRKILSVDASKAQMATLKEQLTMTLDQPESMLVALSFASDRDEAKQSRVSNIIAHHYYVIGALSSDQVELLTAPVKDNSNLTETISVPLSALQELEATLTFSSITLAPVFDVDRDKCFSESLLSSWRAGRNSGGRYGSSSYERNPQYLVEFNQPGIFYLNLIQESNRDHPKRKDCQHAIALHVWKLASPVRKPLLGSTLESNPPDYVTQPTYQYKSDISLFGVASSENRFLVVVPSTYVRDVNCRFHLRVCASTSLTVHCLSGDLFVTWL